MKCVHLIVSGRVQGVFFRANVKNKATELGVNGYAKNLPDGNVAAIVSGVLGVVLSTLAAFAAQLPAPAANAAIENRKKLAKTIPVTAKKRSVKEMKADINTALAPANIKIY